MAHVVGMTSYSLAASTLTTYTGSYAWGILPVVTFNLAWAIGADQAFGETWYNYWLIIPLFVAFSSAATGVVLRRCCLLSAFISPRWIEKLGIPLIISATCLPAEIAQDYSFPYLDIGRGALLSLLLSICVILIAWSLYDDSRRSNVPFYWLTILHILSWGMVAFICHIGPQRSTSAMVFPAPFLSVGLASAIFFGFMSPSPEEPNV